MFTFARYRPRSNWIRVAWLIGLAACLGCGSTAQQAAPGDAEFVEGRQALADANLADANRADGKLIDAKLEQAVAAFDQAIAKNPQNAAAFLKRANAHQRLGQADLAIDDYAKGVRLDPRHADAYSARAALFFDKERFEVAIDDLTEAISLAPESYEPVRLRARAYLAKEKYAYAIDDAQKAIRLNPQCADAYRTLGVALLYSPEPEPDRAIVYLREAVRLDKELATKINPDLALAYFEWGVKLGKIGDWKDVQRAFADAVLCDLTCSKRIDEYWTHNGPRPQLVGGPGGHPNPKVAVLYERAQVALTQGQVDAAIRLFDEILRIDTMWADVWYGRGKAFLARNDPNSAIRDFDQAIRLNPSSAADAYCQRGRAYWMAGDDYRAISDTTEAILLKPDFALAYLYRAEAYVKEKSFDRALADLANEVNLNRKAPQLASTSEDPAQALYVRIYVSQASEYRAARRWDDAITSLESAIHNWPRRTKSGDSIALPRGIGAKRSAACWKRSQRIRGGPGR